MAITEIGKTHKFVGGERVTGIPNALEPTDAVPKQQLDQVASLKQDNMTAGAGVAFNGTEVLLNLAASGTNHAVLTLSGTDHASLDGVYQLAAIKGSLSYSGTSLDLDVGGNYNFYYKDNGGGVWAIVAKRDTDNIHNNSSVGESNGSWIAVLTVNDPTSVTSDFNNYIPNYQSVDYDFLTYSSEQDADGNGAPSSAVSTVSYSVGSTPAGLKFEDGKLAIDFATSIQDSSSTKVFPSSMVKTFIEEGVTSAKESANNVFSNAVAQYTGNPSNVQSALEAAAAAIALVAQNLSNTNTLAASEYDNIDDLQSAIGSTIAHLGTVHADLSDDTTAKALLAELAELLRALRADVNTTVGYDAVGATMVSAGNNIPDGSTLIDALSELDLALGLIQGDLTSRLPAVDQYHSGEQYPLSAEILGGTAPLDMVKYDVINPNTGAVLSSWETDLTALQYNITVLVDYGTQGAIGAGVYERDHATGLLSRVSWLDEDTEVQRNAIMQIRYGGPIAGSEFGISSPDGTQLDVEALGFQNISAVIIGQKTIDKTKLVPTLADEFEGLPRRVDFDVTVAADSTTSVLTGIESASPFTIRDLAGNDRTDFFEIDYNTAVAGEMLITSGANSPMDVKIKIVGVRL